MCKKCLECNDKYKCLVKTDNKQEVVSIDLPQGGGLLTIVWYDNLKGMTTLQIDCNFIEGFEIKGK